MKVKICGILNIDTVNFCLVHNVHYLGFNFITQSPRVLENNTQTVQLLNACPREKAVAIFSIDHKENIGRIDDIMHHYQLTTLQICGLPSKRELNLLASQYYVLCSLQPKQLLEQKKQLQLASALDLEKHCQAIFFDGIHPGSGKTWNFEELKEIENLFHPNSLPEFWLAGGLNPENITTVLKKVKRNFRHHIFGLDVASGVESQKTSTTQKKDPKKILEFIRQAASI